LSSACTIIWWRNALHGTTINQLYYIWNPTEHWRSLKSAISSGVDYKKIFFTTIIISIANLAMAPLFQRASSTRNGLFVKNVTLEVGMVEQLSPSYIGEVYHGNVLAATAWTDISSQWNANLPILLPSYLMNDCDGRCEVTIS